MNKVYLVLLTVIVLLAVALGVVLSQPKSDNLPLPSATPTPSPSPTINPTISPTPSPTATPTQSPTVAPTIDVSVEEVSIANIAFTGTNNIDVLVQNSGSTTVNITQAYVNGVGVTIANAAPWSVDKSAATTFHITSPTNLAAGTSYQIKFITARGNQVQNSAVYNP
jgi:hypothetical protein